MGTYERKVNQLKDLMRRKYKSAYNKSKEMDIDISSMTYLPCPDAFNVINIEKMHVILDRVNKIIDENKDKLKTQLAPLVYIYMIGNGRKDTGKYAAPFGKCATII